MTPRSCIGDAGMNYVVLQPFHTTYLFGNHNHSDDKEDIVKSNLKFLFF